MSRVFETYRAFHEQGFVPIFVKDDRDTRVLLDGCLEAGIRVIEYTLRREDAGTMIPWIRENYPDLHVIVGSTVDDDAIVVQRKAQFPQLFTLDELDHIGVDGFVSMLGYRAETIRRFCGHRLIVPAAWSPTEALQEMGAGAHLIKVTGAGRVERSKVLRAAPAFGYCPIMATGGVTSAERIREAFEAGAVCVASGFDVTLPEGCGTSAQVARAMTDFVRYAAEVRQLVWPRLAEAQGSDRQTWLDALPHYHPF